MKKLFAAVTLLAACGFAMGADKASMSSDTLVWAGLDYSMVKMIGPGEFNEPSVIFPGFLDGWNNRFLGKEIKPLEKFTKKRVVLDVGGVTEQNKTATGQQIVNSPGANDTIDKSHITEQDIAKAVKAYKMENKSGLGLVFIVDRLVKEYKKGNGAVYVVYFDVASREVISSQRVVGKASGFGPRDYWFTVIRNVEKTLKK
jgi:hypothetical protein